VSRANNPSLRWGIVSTAAINDQLVPCFKESQTSELVAVASRSLSTAQEWASSRDVAVAYGSYEELLADCSIDCVYISLPNGLHGTWARAALEAGKHVLCEKPLTPTAAEARELFTLASSRNLVLVEAFMYRHHPQTLTCAKLVRGGRIGELRSVHCSFYFRVDDPLTDIRYRADLAGGALRDVGSYCVSFANFIVGEAPSGFAGAAKVASSGVEERFFGTLEYPSGVVAQFSCGMDTQLHVGATVLGSEGSFRLANPWYADIPGPWLPGPTPMAIELNVGGQITEIPTRARNAYLEEIDCFAGAVNGTGATIVSPDETVRNLETIERLLERAASV
jgi:predicted dehydrogenase